MGKQAPGVPDDPIVEFVGPKPGRFAIDASDPAVKAVRFGLWDNAFKTHPQNAEVLNGVGNGVSSRLEDEALNTLRSGPREQDHFIGCDARRFYLRVTDPGARSRRHVEINWRTLAPGGGKLDAPSPETITLLRVGTSEPPVFVSRGLMLTAFDDDQPRNIHTGLPADHPDAVVRDRATDVVPGNVDYRLRHGLLRGKTEAEYTSPSGRTIKAQADVFPAGEIKKVRLRIVALKRRSVGRPVVDVSGSSKLWSEDVEMIVRIFSQLGIDVHSDLAGADEAGSGTVLGRKFAATVFDAGEHVDVDRVHRDVQRDLASAFPAPDGVVQIFFAGRISIGNDDDGYEKLRGVAYDDGTVAMDPLSTQCKSCIFINAKKRNQHTTAHELGHMLSGKRPSEGHYRWTSDPHTLQQHLMRAGGGPIAPMHLGNRRVWDSLDGDVFNYFKAIRGSRFLT